MAKAALALRLPILFVASLACASPGVHESPLEVSRATEAAGAAERVRPGDPRAAQVSARPSRTPVSRSARAQARIRAARTALDQVGAPYRHGGSSPAGFDCSGLVVWSFGASGFRGLPRSAEALERASRPVPLRELEPGDLLFFRLATKRKTSHVGIYVGDRAFVHAPSSGKRVERVSFDHVYWGPRISRAGRLSR